MKKIAICLIVFLLLCDSAAYAKTPPEILEPYKAYKAALEKGDMASAAEHALTAWEKAESLLGDDKVTGALARNFALIENNGHREFGANPELHYQKRFEAQSRSIELARLHTEDERVETELIRRFEFLDLIYSKSIIRRRPLAPMKGIILKQINKIESIIKKNGLKGGTYEGDLEAMRAGYDGLRGHHDKALAHADKAYEIYDNAKDDVVSYYPNTLRMIKGNALLGKEQPILAALEFQKAMQSGEGEVSAEHPFINGAFAAWMSVRMKLEEDGRLQEAEQAGLCKCWPFENYENKIYPIKRIPPKMPQIAKRSGHVIVMFDVDIEGNPYNIRELSSSSPIFVTPAIQAVKQWEFPKLGPKEDPSQRLGITNKISFRLTGFNGKILPE